MIIENRSGITILYAEGTNKIANKKGCNVIAFDYVVNKHNLTYTLEKNNTILFFKKGA